MSVTFDLTSDCDKLKEFHREFGTKYSGWLNSDGTVSEGWKSLLRYVVGQPPGEHLGLGRPEVHLATDLE